MATATSEPSKKFSVAFHDMKFMFESFLMIISISQSKRGGRTTLRSDSMGAKVSKCSFFKNHAQTPLSTSTGDFKRRVSQSGDGGFKASKKFSVASHDMKFEFASFLMIISISQSKRGDRTTLRSDSIGAKVSKWSFFKNHAH